MMTMIDNFDESKGALWSIGYLARKKIEISDASKQRFLDRQSREFTNLFDPPPGLTPDEYSALFVSHFMKAREKSREIIEKGSERFLLFTTVVQIGNKECLDELVKIEQSEDFHSWEQDGYWVNEFRRVCKLYE